MKSPGLAPPSATLLIVMVVVWVLVRVTDFCAPLPPTGTKFQFKDVGVTVAEAKQTAAFDEANPSTARVVTFLKEMDFANAWIR